MKYRFLTTTRDDLVILSTIFADAIKPKIFNRKKRPIIVKVNGSFGAGKKVVPDVMRERLLGSTALAFIEGRRDCDECVVGELEGKTIRADFINIAWAAGYGIDQLDCLDESDRRKHFLGLNTLPGVVFVHNDYTKPLLTPYDMSVWIEGLGNIVDGHQHLSKLQQGSNLRDIFNELVLYYKDHGYDDSWLRYVEVDVKKSSVLDMTQLQCVEGARKRRGISKAIGARKVESIQGGIYTYA